MAVRVLPITPADASRPEALSAWISHVEAPAPQTRPPPVTSAMAVAIGTPSRGKPRPHATEPK